MLVSATRVLEEPVVTSESGEGAVGNLKSEKAGEVMESIFGVFGPEGRWKGELLSGG